MSSARRAVTTGEDASASRHENEVGEKSDAPATKPQNVRALGVAPTSSPHQTADERAAFVKQQAQQRMAERLAALGLKPPSKTAEPSRPREERNPRERNESSPLPSATDSVGDSEGLRRSADENSSPRPAPKPLGKKPPPPPTRGTRSGSLHGKKGLQDTPADPLAKKEKAIRQQQEEQSVQTKELEYVDPVP